MRYAHCQAPANFYDTLFLPRHTPLFRAGLSSVANRQLKHDTYSRAVVTLRYPRPFGIQSRHANSHDRHYSCMEVKSKIHSAQKKPAFYGLYLGSQTHGMRSPFIHSQLTTRLEGVPWTLYLFRVGKSCESPQSQYRNRSLRAADPAKPECSTPDDENQTFSLMIYDCRLTIVPCFRMDHENRASGILCH